MPEKPRKLEQEWGSAWLAECRKPRAPPPAWHKLVQWCTPVILVLGKWRQGGQTSHGYSFGYGELKASLFYRRLCFTTEQQHNWRSRKGSKVGGMCRGSAHSWS